MFDLSPISTTNLFSLLQILVVLGGFYFSWKSLESTRRSIDVASESLKVASENLALSTSNAQAQLINQIVVQGRDLQYKYMDIFITGNRSQDAAEKQKLCTGSVIAYISSCYELGKVLQLPTNIQNLLEAELRVLMNKEHVRKQWDEIKDLHSKEFGRYVESLRGVK